MRTFLNRWVDLPMTFEMECTERIDTLHRMEPSTNCETGPHCFCLVDEYGRPKCHWCGCVKPWDENLDGGENS
jgi:hypothetical protein